MINKDTLAVGTKLRAIQECIMEGTEEPSLVIGEVYEVLSVSVYEDPEESCILIKDCEGVRHFFNIISLEEYFEDV